MPENDPRRSTARSASSRRGMSGCRQLTPGVHLKFETEAAGSYRILVRGQGMIRRDSIEPGRRLYVFSLLAMLQPAYTLLDRKSTLHPRGQTKLADTYGSWLA